GIKLLVNQPVETGTLLSVELPGVLVLACVTHVTASSPEEWTLGCAFATELQEDDLQLIGARPAPDRRTGARFSYLAPVTYSRVDSDEARARSAEVTDISVNGIGLVVTDPINIGTLLSLALHGRDQPEAFSLLACVVRVTPQEGGTSILGC